jgi:hypothetical protein
MKSNILVEDDGEIIEVYGDIGDGDSTAFSEEGLKEFLYWCKQNKSKLCREIF